MRQSLHRSFKHASFYNSINQTKGQLQILNQRNHLQIIQYFKDETLHV